MTDEGFRPAPPLSSVRVGPAPWSGVAIAGFVCSLLGCLGITALVGLVLGVAGLFATSGGKRRGFGFAVAAIPLSLLTGIGSGFLLLAVLVGRQIMEMPIKVESAFTIVSSDPAAAADAFRAIASDDFNQAVDDDGLAGWFASITADHGSLTKILVDPRDMNLSQHRTGKFVQSVRGKFINDTVAIELTYAPASGFGKIKLDDISVGGSSPLDAKPPDSTP